MNHSEKVLKLKMKAFKIILHFLGKLTLTQLLKPMHLPTEKSPQFCL